MDLGGCPIYTYTEGPPTCSVYDFDSNHPENQYSESLDDCCLGYKYTEDQNLLAACAEPTVESICTKEVFEGRSMVCNTVTSERLVYATMTSADAVAAV